MFHGFLYPAERFISLDAPNVINTTGSSRGAWRSSVTNYPKSPARSRDPDALTNVQVFVQFGNRDCNFVRQYRIPVCSRQFTERPQPLILSTILG